VLRPGDVAFDVGANVGLFTLLMSRIVGPSGRVVAYEAAPENAALLRDTIAMNYQAEWVDIRQAAAAASAGTLTFHASTRFLGNGSLLPHDEQYTREFLVDGERELSVAAEPLDVHLGAFERIALVKIDVEGAEEQVLAGMQGLIDSGAVQRICMELLRSRMGDDWEAISQRLTSMTDAGWTLSLLGQRGERQPVALSTVLENGRYSQLLLQRSGVS
jgi:FkbM family methyltransferase